MSPKKGSTVQKTGKTKRKRKLIEEPPVVVGGGNSVDIIFKNTATNPANPPGLRKFRLPNVEITSVVIQDGTGATQLVRVSGAYKVSFF